MRVVTIPCLRDNYAYLLVCESSNLAAVVDPSEAAPVVEAVEREGVELGAIWNTHHHPDHVGGNKALLERFPTLQVVAHESDRGRVPGQTTFAQEGDEVELGSELAAAIFFNPGHTTGAISYYLAAANALFTGDTLFAAGCGRLFEGSPQQMYTSLRRLSSLPETTRVYCGHEYTLANLNFASQVEPNNSEIAARIARCEELRSAGETTMGFTLAEELATNVFLRVDQPELKESLAKEEPPSEETATATFAALRRWKDRF